MKLIISFFIFLYIPSVSAYFAPQAGGVSNNMICAIAIQAGMTGQRKNKALTEKELRTRLDEFEEAIDEVKDEIEDIEEGMLALMKDSISCQNEEVVKQQIYDDIYEHMEKAERRFSKIKPNTIQCPMDPTAEGVETSYLNNILKLPFALVVPAYANAVIVNEQRAYCCKKISETGVEANPPLMSGTLTSCRERDEAGKVVNLGAIHKFTTGTTWRNSRGSKCGKNGLECCAFELGITLSPNNMVATTGVGDEAVAATGGEGGDNDPADATDPDPDSTNPTNPVADATATATAGAGGNGRKPAGEEGTPPATGTCTEDECSKHYKQYFERNGRVNGDICKLITADKGDVRECEDSLIDLKRYIEDLKQYTSDRDDLDREFKDRRYKNRRCKFYPDGEECGELNTQAGSFCTECFNEVIQAAYPKKSGFEQFLNFLIPSAALYMGYEGIKQNNKLVALAGFEPDNSAYTQLAYPFLLSGVYGGQRGLNPCSPTTSSYGFGGGMGASLLGSLLGGGGGLGFYGGLGGFPGGIGGFPNFGGGFSLGGFPGSIGIGGFPGGIGGFPNFGGGFSLGGFPGGGFSIGGFPGGGLSPFGGGLSAFGGGLPFMQGGLSPFGGGLGAFGGQNYSLQFEAMQKAQAAYMEQMQLLQRRNMDKYSAISTLQQEMIALQQQMQRILTGYGGGAQY